LIKASALRKITFNQIENFLAAAVELNYSRAAERLGITQPTLSKSVSTLEKMIGVKLFYRKNSGLALTPAGEYLNSAYGRLYPEITKAAAHARALEFDAQKAFRISFPSFYDLDDGFQSVRNICEAFKKKFPAVAVKELLRDFRDQRRELEDGKVDLGFAQDFVMHNCENISIKKVARLGRYLALAVDHPLAKNESVDFKSLAGELFFRVAAIDDDQHMRDLLIRECRGYDFTPREIVLVPNMVTFMHNIQEQRGVGICGLFINYQEGFGIKYYKLPVIDETPYIIAAWRTDNDMPEIKAMLSLIPDIA